MFCSGLRMKVSFSPVKFFHFLFPPPNQPPTSLLLCSSMSELGSRERERKREGAQRHNCHSRDDDVIIGRSTGRFLLLAPRQYRERERCGISLSLLFRLIDGIISSSSFFVSSFVHSQMICITSTTTTRGKKTMENHGDPIGASDHFQSG